MVNIANALVETREKIIGEYFSSQGGVLVRHDVKGDLEPAHIYLTNRGIQPDELHQVFSTDGQLLSSTLNQKKLWRGSPEQVDTLLREAFAPAYTLVDRSLSTLRPGGFNLHGEPHIDNVTTGTVRLLQAAGADRMTLVRGIVAARAHDLANLISRDNHALLSPEILRRLIPEVETESSNWKIIRRAIEVHDTDVIRLSEPSWDSMMAEDKIKWMQECGLEASALIIADKSDIGRQRVNHTPYDVNTHDVDPHTEVNLLGFTKKLKKGKGKKTLVWELEFAPDMSTEEIEMYPHFNKGVKSLGEWQARTSTATEAVNRYGEIPYFDIWRSQLWKLYLPGIERVICASFALFPKLEHVSIRMIDEKNIAELRHDLARNQIDHFINLMKKRYSREEIESN